MGTGCSGTLASEGYAYNTQLFILSNRQISSVQYVIVTLFVKIELSNLDNSPLIFLLQKPRCNRCFTKNIFIVLFFTTICCLLHPNCQDRFVDIDEYKHPNCQDRLRVQYIWDFAHVRKVQLVANELSLTN